MSKILDKFNKKQILVLVLLVMTVYSRFVNLNWDRGWGLHPDENNLWGASRRVVLFSKLDPEFYAYGGLPIYGYSLLTEKSSARVISAMVQVLIVLGLYYWGKEFFGASTGILAATMGALSAGLVQAGHFLTVESLLGIFGLLVVAGIGCYKKKNNLFWLILAGIGLGLGAGTKISFAVFCLPLTALLITGKKLKKNWPGKLLLVGLVLLIGMLFFILTNPYLIERWNDVRGILNYESRVATGDLRVFYTRQFNNSIPGWFQVKQVFPYVASWTLPWLFLIGIWRLIKKKNYLFILAGLASLLSFVPWWAKWTRYVVQVLPVLILVAGVGLAWIWDMGKFGKVIVLGVLATFLSPFANMLGVYTNQDTRILASDWAGKNITKNSKIFTEGMDLGILPFNPDFGANVTLFNFYELDDDESGEKKRELANLIEESDYFISLSSRIYGNSLVNDEYSKSAEFYRSLFDGSLGFEKVKEFVVYNRPEAEETFQVFDHPKIMIFKRI